MLDTNVLFPASLRDTLLRLVGHGCFNVHWSSETLRELDRNLVSKGQTSAAGAKRLVAAVVDAFPDATVSVDPLGLSQLANDPKDRHVAGAALAVGADFVVTFDLRGFDPIPDRLLAVHPDEFLQAVLRSHRDGVLSALRIQAAALKSPPMSLDDLLDRLAAQTPRFVQAVRAQTSPG